MATEFNRLNPNLVFDFNDVVPGGLGIFKIILKQNPLLYFRFQESSGPAIDDLTSNDNDGVATPTGITYGEDPPVAEVTDSAILFTDGYISVDTTSPTLSQNFSEFSVECWIKVGSLPVSEQTIVGKGDGPGNDHFQLSLTPDGRIKFWWSDNTAAKLAYSKSTVGVNTWVHIMAVWDGSDNVVYLNGEAGTAVSNAVSPVTSPQDIQIGAYNSAGRFQGRLDELAIYATALVQADAEDRLVFDSSVNTIPVINSVTANGVSSGTVNIFEGDSVTLIINATDDDSDTLSYSFSTDGFLPSVGPQLSNTTVVTYDSAGTFNPIAFVTDGISNRAAPFPTIEVDRRPDLIAFGDSFFTGFRESKTLDVLANDSFPAGGGGSISALVQPANGTVSLQGSGESATILYEPDTDFFGTDTFTYTITSAAGGASTALVTVEVAEKQPPRTSDFSVKIEPDSSDNILLPQSNDVSDPPGETLTLVEVQNPSTEGGTVFLDLGNNRVLYTPPAGYTGADSFSYIVEDEAGLQSTGTVNVTIDTIIFEAVSDTAQCPYEDAVEFNVLVNDTTPFGFPLSVVGVTPPPVGEGTVTIVDGALGILRYDASGTGFFGGTSFTYDLDDGNGNTDTGTVSITVLERPPVAQTDRLSTPLDTAVSLDVMANDYDPEGASLALTAFTQPPAGEGTVTREENGTPGDQTDDTLLYTPPAGFRGVTSFTYTIEDAVGQTAVGTVQVAVSYTLELTVDKTFGPVTETFAFQANPTAASGFDKSYTYFWDFGDGETSTARTPTHLFTGIGLFEVSCTVTDSYGEVQSDTITVEVIANTRPVANNITTEVAEGQTLNFDPRVNDSDEDGDPIYIVDADATSAQGGSVFLNNNATPVDPYDDFITYVHPALPTPFTDTFDYTISDEYGLEATATVTVNVLENLAPSAVSQFRGVIYEEPLTIDVLNGASDPEGDELFVTSVTSPDFGTASVISPEQKQVLYTPPDGFLGAATFDYTIRDEFSNTDTSQISVSVFGQYYPKLVFNDDPIAYWPFNEPSGITAYDLKETLSHGTYVKNVPRTELGPLAKDLENAANVDQGYIIVRTSKFRDLITDGFSLEVWSKVTLRTSSTIILGLLEVAGNATVYEYVLPTSAGTERLTIPGRELNEWYHIVLTYDGEWMRAYIDGALVASRPHTGDVNLPVSLPLGQGMTGYLSDLAIYDRKLTAAEIQAHYLEALGPVQTFELFTPEEIQAGDEFNVEIRARDITGKTVTTDDSTQVALSSDDDLEFDSDNDGIWDEP